MADRTWHRIDSDGSVRFRSAGHVSASVLRALYENCTGFDVELFGTAGAGEDPDTLRPVRAHKMILMHASKHLHELFTVDGYLDSHQTQYKLTEISHESLRDIVKFVYTDELNFDADYASHYVQNVLIGAKFLVMCDLADACETYLSSDKHLAVQNCMSMLRFARRYGCLLLLTALLNLTAKNLPYFIENLDFLNLTKEEVSKLLLSEPVVTLADTGQRCRAAVAWLNYDRLTRDECVDDILSLVPFDPSTMSLHTLAAVGNNSAIRTKYAEKFLNVMFDGVKNCRLQNDERCCASNQTVSDVLWNACHSRDMWYIVGGSHADKDFLTYDVARRYWSKLPSLPWTRAFVGACVMGQNNNKAIFVFGGEKNAQNLRYRSMPADIDRYDLTTHEWTTSNVKLSIARSCVTVCANVDEKSAYVCGGWVHNASNVMEQLSVSHNVAGKSSLGLEVMPKMCVRRSNSAAVSVVDDAFFLAGGVPENLGDSRLSSIEKYDSVANKWSTIGNLKRGGRSSIMSAVLGDDWYLAGGYNGKSNVSFVEVFNTRTGQIRRAPSMLTTRCGGSGVALDRNTFCAVGGGAGLHDSLRSVECFDIREGKWTTGGIVPDMPTGNRSFGFVRL